MTERDARIVRLARLYRLIAERPTLANARDVSERIERTSRSDGGSLSLVDCESVEDMEEIDRVCGAAVALLSKSWNAGIADVLGWLDSDRLAAVVLALPPGRRRTVASRDPVWVRAWASVDLEAVEEVEQLISDFDRAGDQLDELWRAFGLDPETFTDEARRALVGLPAE